MLNNNHTESLGQPGLQFNCEFNYTELEGVDNSVKVDSKADEEAS